MTLYRGDLLAGLRVNEEPWETWIRDERERLREQAVEGLAKVLAHQRKGGQLKAAIGTAHRLLMLDRLQEPVHRTLMRLHAQLGQRGAALRQYQECVNVLQRELGVEPEAETRQLYREILQQRTAGGMAPAYRRAADPAAPPRARKAPETRPAETPLIGRDAEMEQLCDAFGRALGGVRGVPTGGDCGEEGRRDRPGAHLVPEVHRNPRRADLGPEPGGRRLDVYVRDPGFVNVMRACALLAAPIGLRTKPALAR